MEEKTNNDFSKDEEILEILEKFSKKVSPEENETDK